ncbi:MAG: Rieske 2Fe-2S domain-containing protein [Deltaproteobacteria bacterium]|nr:Rieske 2Fe-2S domain-containing protein [Deltaproteobacteria bacterium]
MALTHEENDLFTRVGPGSRAGRMMRAYWHPIGFAKELQDKPKRRKLLGEDLVLFRDEKGRLGLLGLHCPHRGTSLEFGYLEDGGIRCCYHGWLFDVDGHCLEQPAEPPESSFKDRIGLPAYKAEELGGVIFAYLGPEPAPLVPRYDVLVREDGVRSMGARVQSCNYFQAVENTVDQHHFRFLHRTPSSRHWKDVELHSQITEFGIQDRYARRVGDEKYTTVSYFIMPTMNKTGYHHEEDHPAGFRAAHPGYEAMRWRVPMDNTHTLHVTVAFSPLVDGQPAPALPPDRQEEGISETPAGIFRWDESIGAIARGDQDRCAQESQGPIYDRTTEHLGVSDKGVILLRNMYKQCIESVESGMDPVGVIRSHEKNKIIEIIPWEETSS